MEKFIEKEDDRLSLELRTYAYLSRNYLDSQQKRIANDARIQKLVNVLIPEKKYNSHEKIHRDWGDIITRIKKHTPRYGVEGLQLLKELSDINRQEEQRTLKKATSLFSRHPIWSWCVNTKGLGPVAALTFLGFINPYVAYTAKSVWKYAGLDPDNKSHKWNRHFKGRLLGVIVTSLMRQKSPYYYPLYKKKKEYYLKDRGMEQYIEDPTKCPNYSECTKKLRKTAQRQNREPKKPSCKGHIDNMAKRWLAKILLGHALEVMKMHEGLDASVLRSHREYIPPNPGDN
jgi:hypothetical protein